MPDIYQAIAEYPHWRHIINVGNGVSTAGSINCAPILSLLALPSNLVGKRVLDAGCGDGFFSFECERRGAKVTAIDISPTGLPLAAEAKGSKVRYFQIPVEEFTEVGFDTILLLDTLQYLEHPIEVLHRLCHLHRGADIYLSTLCLDEHFQTKRDEAPRRLVDIDPRLEAASLIQYVAHTDLHPDRQIMWMFSSTALRELLNDMGYKLDYVKFANNHIYLHAYTQITAPAARARIETGPWWTGTQFTKTKDLKIMQICPTYNQPCGVGNFSRNFSAALIAMGYDVENVTKFQNTDADVIILQHEFGLFAEEELRLALPNYACPKLLFAHTPGIERLSNYVDGFFGMCPGMITSSKPFCLFPHPGGYYGIIDRIEAKQKHGLAAYKTVIGTNGFLNASRQFPIIATELLKSAYKNDWLIYIACSKHFTHESNNEYQKIERELLQLQATRSRLVVDTAFTSQEMLNSKLQACDLLWCWTNAEPKPYGSGTASDQYCSGVRLVVTDKPQHSTVFGLPNVVRAPDTLSEFISTLMNEADAKHFDRHDPQVLSWENCIPIAAEFIERLCLT